MLIIEIQYLCVILRAVFLRRALHLSSQDERIIFSRNNIVAVERNQHREAHRQARRQFLIFFYVLKQGRHVSRPPLGCGIQRDGDQLVVDERIVESVLHRSGKCLAVIFRQRKNRDNFLFEHPVHVSAHRLVMHAVADDIEASKIRARHKSRVRAIEDAHLPLLVRHDLRHKMHICAGGAEGFLQLPQALLRRIRIIFPNRRQLLDIPHAKNFPDNKQLVAVAVFFFHLCKLRLIAHAPRHNAIDQRGAEYARTADPVSERVFQLPVGGVTQHAVPEDQAVVVNQLARQDCESRKPRLPARIQKLCQLCREARRRRILQLARRIIDDTRFRRVADDILQLRAADDLLDLRPVPVRVAAAAGCGDDPFPVDLLAVLTPAKIQRVKAVLRIHAVRAARARRRRLHHRDLATKARPLIRNIDEIIRKRPQEVSLPELQHLYRRFFQQISIVPSLF